MHDSAERYRAIGYAALACEEVLNRLSNPIDTTETTIKVMRYPNLYGGKSHFVLIKTITIDGVELEVTIREVMR